MAIKKIICALIILSMSFACPIVQAAENASPREYVVKAAFLYNFIRFTGWPGEEAVSAQHPATLCIKGANPFGNAFDLLKSASRQPFLLHVLANPPDKALSACNALFIARDNESRLEAILAKIKGRPILSVSDIAGFADHGGMVEMTTAESSVGLFSRDKVRLRINARVAAESGLHLDAQLLEIASDVIK